MEVILKKSKISGSILNQTLIANAIQLKTFEVLGFCVLKNQQWIVLYKAKTNELKKYLMFTEVNAETYDLENVMGTIKCKFMVRVNFGGNYMSKIYKTDNESESEEFVKMMSTIRHQARYHGQLFL